MTENQKLAISNLRLSACIIATSLSIAFPAKSSSRLLSVTCMNQHLSELINRSIRQRTSKLTPSFHAIFRLFDPWQSAILHLPSTLINLVFFFCPFSFLLPFCPFLPSSHFFCLFLFPCPFSISCSLPLSYSATQVHSRPYVVVKRADWGVGSAKIIVTAVRFRRWWQSLLR